MKFADREHKDKYMKLAALCQFDPAERDFTAAIYLLSSPILARRCAKYVQPGQIKFSELMPKIGPWSSGEKALVKLAAAMYNSRWKVDVNDIFGSLDDKNTGIALEALKIRWG